MTKKEYVQAFAKYPSALTVAEVAEILRVSTKTVYKMIKQGDIPAVRVGREKRIAKTELINFLRSGEQKVLNPVQKVSENTPILVWTPQNSCDNVRVANGRYITKGVFTDVSKKHVGRKRTGKKG